MLHCSSPSLQGPRGEPHRLLGELIRRASVWLWPGITPCVKSRRRLIAIEQVIRSRPAFGAHTASPFDFEIEPENIILVALRLFEFPHGLGQRRTLLRAPGDASHIRYAA